MGERLAGPQRMVPITTGDPFARLQSLGVVLDAPDELLGRRRIPEIHRGELEPAADEVSVSVGEAGQDETAAGLNRLGLRAGITRDLRAVADSEDLAIGEGNRALLGCAVREAGPDHPTGDDDVGLPGAGGEGQAEESQRKASAHVVPQRSFVMRWMVSSAAIGSAPAVFPDPDSPDAGRDASASRMSSSTSSKSCSRW